MRRVTIGIPSYNEGQNITNLLQSLQAQDAQIFEVIISDDSSDNTPDLVRDFAECSSSLNIKLFHHNARRGAWAAWNEIFQEATGDTIVLYDADTIPHPCCTKQLASAVEGNVGLCASNPRPVQSEGIGGMASVFISKWLRSVRLTGLSQYTLMGRALAVDSGITKNIKIPRDIIAIDLYIQCKTLELGRHVIYNDNAIVYFKPANTMEDIASQVMRAVNGHNQIKQYVSSFNISLPLRLMITHAVKNAIQDPLGALSVAMVYSLLPYYRSRLDHINNAMWHTATSSKTIDYQQLKMHF